jgi:hypothetical protein
MAILAMLASAGAASARAHPLHCGNVRVNRFLHPAPAGTFGAFGITASGAGAACAAARDIASRYVHHPTEKKTTRLNGWKCTIERVLAAQRVSVKCTRGTLQVNFADEVPNG